MNLLDEEKLNENDLGHSEEDIESMNESEDSESKIHESDDENDGIIDDKDTLKSNSGNFFL